MPTPVGHSLAGVAVTLAGRRNIRRPWLFAFGLIALANIADVDFLPGYLSGTPRAYHWGPTHSIFAALTAGVIVGLLGRRWLGGFLGGFVLATAAYGSHLVMDALLGGGAPSVGLQLLWPLNTERFMSPWPIFEMFPLSIERVGPVRALFSRAVLPLIRRELLILTPVCVAAFAFGSLRRTGRASRATRAAVPRSHAPVDPAES